MVNGEYLADFGTREESDKADKIDGRNTDIATGVSKS
jgi:hypothetical protein